MKYTTTVLVLSSIFCCGVESRYITCNPGEEKFDNVEKTICRPCQPGLSFSMDGNKCQPCSRCYTGQALKEECATTSDTYCVCPSHEYLSKKDLACTECKTCRVGYYQTLECGSNINRECKECPEGMTTNGTNEKKCIQKIVKPEKREVITETVIPLWAKILITAFGILLAFVCILFIYCFKQNIKNFFCVEKNERKKIYRAECQPLTRGHQALHPLTVDLGKRNSSYIKDLPGNIWNELGDKLNPSQQRNWVMLAGLLGYTHTDIANFGLQPRRATQDLLLDWGTQQDATAHRLYTILLSMHRTDAAMLLKPFLEDSFL